MNGVDEILRNSVKYFQKAFSKNGKFKVNKQIHRKLKLLREDYGLSEKEIFQELYEDFLEKKKYEKYDTQTALSTFITYCVKYGLDNLYRKQCCQKRRKEVSLEALLDNVLCEGSTGSKHGYGLSSLVEFVTPEDLVIAKELITLVIEYFGRDDALVLLTQECLQTEAKNLAIDYDTYRKRLLRKKRSFLDVLEEAGYKIH